MKFEFSPVPSNLTQRFFDQAKETPQKLAIVDPLSWTSKNHIRERSLTYLQFATETQRLQSQLKKCSLLPGDRVIVMIKPSLSLYTLLAALFAEGLIPVFIDLAAAKWQWTKMLETASVKAVFLNKKRWGLSLFFPFLKTLPCYFLDEFKSEIVEAPKLVSCEEHSTALITFTTGSSELPKAVNRTLDVLFYQREISHQLWTGNDWDVELTLFPMVVLSNLIFGKTTILPAHRYGRIDEKMALRLVSQIKKHKVSRLAAPPSVLHRLTQLDLRKQWEEISTVQKIVTGGAPVPQWLVQEVSSLFPQADSHVVYGSSEAEPISHISFDDVCKSNALDGYCVGPAISAMDTSLVDGELLVSGPHVVRSYLNNESATTRTKIRDSEGRIWHRTGDSVAEDTKKNLWIQGRESHKTKLPSPYCHYGVEHFFENLLKARVALITSPKNELTVFCEKDPMTLSPSHKNDFLTLSKSLYCKIVVHKKLPVDARHQWKIDRHTLGLRKSFLPNFTHP